MLAGETWRRVLPQPREVVPRARQSSERRIVRGKVKGLWAGVRGGLPLRRAYGAAEEAASCRIAKEPGEAHFVE